MMIEISGWIKKSDMEAMVDKALNEARDTIEKGDIYEYFEEGSELLVQKGIESNQLIVEYVKSIMVFDREGTFPAMRILFDVLEPESREPLFCYEIEYMQGDEGLFLTDDYITLAKDDDTTEV